MADQVSSPFSDFFIRVSLIDLETPSQWLRCYVRSNPYSSSTFCLVLPLSLSFSAPLLLLLPSPLFLLPSPPSHPQSLRLIADVVPLTLSPFNRFLVNRKTSPNFTSSSEMPKRTRTTESITRTDWTTPRSIPTSLTSYNLLDWRRSSSTTLPNLEEIPFTSIKEVRYRFWYPVMATRLLIPGLCFDRGVQATFPLFPLLPRNSHCCSLGSSQRSPACNSPLTISCPRSGFRTSCSLSLNSRSRYDQASSHQERTSYCSSPPSHRRQSSVSYALPYHLLSFTDTHISLGSFNPVSLGTLSGWRKKNPIPFSTSSSASSYPTTAPLRSTDPLNIHSDHIAKGHDFQARARWGESGSVTLWDNRITAHSALIDWNDGIAGRRHGARITAQAERPFI